MCENFINKFKEKVGQTVAPNSLACIRFLYKVVHIGRLRKFNRARDIEFKFFIAWTIFMKLGTLVHHVHGYKRLPSLAIRRFYIAFVRPRLEYCNAAWCGLTRIQAVRLEKVQVRVARAIVRCPRCSRSHALQDAGLPTLSWRRREHCLGLLWKLVNGIGPPALLNVLPATAASRSSSVLRSSHSLQFPLCLSSRRKSSFLCYAIPIWNGLSSSVTSCSSVSSFQCSLRKAFADDKFTFNMALPEF